MSDWKAVAAKVANAGLPTLAKIIDGAIPAIPGVGPIIGMFVDPEDIEWAARKALSTALGVDMEPSAVAAAIENKSTTDVTSTLKGVQEGLSQQFPALVEIFKSEDVLDAKIAEENAETFRTLAAGDMARNDYWWSLYRGVVMNGTAVIFLALLLSLLVIVWNAVWAVVQGRGVPLNADTINALVAIYGVGFTACGGILGFHWKFRKDERVAAITPPPPSVVAPTTVVAAPAKVVKK